MQIIQFDKMEGAGNDYIYVDARTEPIEHPEALSIAMSNRHFGVGADGLVLILNSDKADFKMRMFNADGSEAEMCGNASRCVGKYLYEKGITKEKEIKLETKSGIKVLQLLVHEQEVKSVCVDMNTPALEANEIPVNHDQPQQLLLEGMYFTCVSMGNPHAVTFVEDTLSVDVATVGSKIENNPLFPQKTNVEFAQIIAQDRIRMRVWERGSGETLACGTGACATLVAAVLKGKTARRVTVELLGGEVEVEWNQQTNHVTLTGNTAWVFKGEYKYDTSK